MSLLLLSTFAHLNDVRISAIGHIPSLPLFSTSHLVPHNLFFNAYSKALHFLSDRNFRFLEINWEPKYLFSTHYTLVVYVIIIWFQ